MGHLKPTLGYSIAFLSILIAIGSYASDGWIGKEIVKRGKLVVSPNMYGGDIDKTINYNGYKIIIHKPVFQGLFHPRNDGFLQVDIIKDENVPDVIHEKIDFDGDNTIEFSILYDTSTDRVEVESYHPNISTHFTGIKRKSAYTVRLPVTKPDY